MSSMMTLPDPISVSQGQISHWPRYGARATPCALSFFGFLVLAALLAGCASGHQMMVGQAQSVHTFWISYNNSHALVAGDRTILVDAGLEGDASKLLQRLEDAGITLSSIAAVIVTQYPRVKTFLSGHFVPVSRDSVEELLEERRAR